MKKIIKLFLTGILTTSAGIALMAFPFHIFEFLTPFQTKIIFAAEIIIYFLIYSIFAVKYEAKSDRKAKNEQLTKKHNERVEKRKKELDGIKIPDYDFAA